MTTLTALPTPPMRSDPTSFSARADAFLAALPGFRTQMNAIVSELNILAAGMNNVAAGSALSIPLTFDTTTTDSDPGNGKLRLDNATQNLATVIRTDLIGTDGSTWTNVIDVFDDSTSTVKGFITLVKVADPTKFLVFAISSMASPAGYRNITVTNVASSAASPFANGDALLLKFTRTGDKGDTGATGATGPSGAALPHIDRTSNTILGATDKGKFFDVTGGTFTQTFDTPANLGVDWFCWYRNSGTGDITIPSSDGVTNWIMYPGEARLFTCNGTALQSVVVRPFYKVFAASGTFIKPPGYSRIAGCMWGGGGSGGKQSSTTIACGGGGGGAYAPFSYAAVDVLASETVTVGAGGVARTTDGSAGANGGSSSFKTVTAYGANDATGGSPFFASVAYSGSHVIGSGVGSYAFFAGASSYFTTPYGYTIYGGSAGGSIDTSNIVRSPAANSIYGGAGGAADNSGGNGVNGSAPGGGGGATRTGAQSGAGGRGEVRIWGEV